MLKWKELYHQIYYSAIRSLDRMPLNSLLFFLRDFNGRIPILLKLSLKITIKSIIL